MSSRTTTKAANRVAWVFVILGAVTLGAVATVAQMGRVVPAALHKQPPVEATAQPQQPDKAEAPKTEKVKTFRVGFTPDFTTESHVSDVPPGVDPKLFTLNDYLSQIKAVPQEARVQSVTVSDGVATIDFPPALRHGYGTEDEQMVVEGICRVMGQFPEVKWVKFTIDGQSVDTLGNIDLSRPLAVTR